MSEDDNSVRSSLFDGRRTWRSRSAARGVWRRFVAYVLLASMLLPSSPLLLAYDSPFDSGWQQVAPASQSPDRPFGEPGQGKPPDGNKPGSREPEGQGGRQPDRPDRPDAPTRQPGQDNTANDPINLFTGAYLYSHEDLVVPGQGLPLKIVRNYNSVDLVEGAFGAGWQSPFSVALFETTDGTNRYALVRLADGDRIAFPLNADGSYRSPDGHRDALVRTSTGWDLSRPWKTVYRFDSLGRLSRIFDLNRNALSFRRDSSGRVTSVVDLAGRTLTLAYTTTNKIASIVDPAGGVYRYGYDAEQDLTQFTNPANQTVRYAYDANHRLTSIADGNGNSWLGNTYDASGRVTVQTYNGGTWSYSYQGTPPTRTYVTDPFGNQSWYYFDPQGRLLQHSAPDAGTYYQTWNSQGLVASITDADGGSTQYEYDPAGNLSTLRDAAGRTSTLQYDAATNKPTQGTDPLGRQVSSSYDAR
ncbi:MAG: RHS repeat protein, partial [Candidatus Wallbacteria bacterium]|nr:RHS repeat protein [Candidatus Wallbacteria bacterium]